MGKVTFNIPDFREGAKKAFAEVHVDIADIALHWGMKALFKTLGSKYFTDDRIATSYLGTPVASNLTFGKVIENVLSKYVEGTGSITSNAKINYYYDLQGNKLPFYPIRIDTVLLTVSKTKRIVKTELQGHEGTIKEYIGSDDYVITAQGVLNIGGHSYPQSAVELLKTICEIPDQIPVTSKFLDIFGIDYVVITDYEFEEMRGQQYQQAFNITMLSDVAPEMEIVDVETINSNYDTNTNAQNA